MSESVFVQASSAAAGAAISTLAFYPLELIKTRLQAQVGAKNKANSEETSTDSDVHASGLDAFYSIVSSQGYSGLYQGVTPVLFRSISSDSLYFLISTKVMNAVKARLQRELSTTEAIVIGFLSACSTQLFAHPVDTICTKVVTDRQNRPANYHIQSITRRLGFTGLWKGYSASMILSLNPALQFTTFDKMKNIILEKLEKTELNPGETFLLGMATKAMTLTVIYPLIRGKIRMQATIEKNHNAGNNGSMLYSLKEIYDAEGVGGYYKGLNEQLLKSIMSTALLLTAKDSIARTIKRLIVKSKPNLTIK
eukprot:CAMPEP_0204824842 /NCGR_PEP_ID=MMETSP1346-20131115/2825_1 /ASSEMBLY_ACC=CAM_ASM_000771 /TAXON_ID=215587 /ORGANISM="Aplanochytrium stocchinoi, Strain GSBS06" /LENGTH=308 /DNA_ID=CAMNT_0051952215 /DNA_START=125 /DNA_END=1051 /DNA_ORIENTATION=-